MTERKTCLMTREDVRGALSIADAVTAVEEAFRAYGEGRVQMPPKCYLDFDRGDLRCMPAYVPELGLAAVKNVNVHPANTDVPPVMATLTVIDPETGYPLAIMDGTYLTAMRTGAAGGIAAKYLARPDSSIVCCVGAGRQAETQLAALMVTMPGLRRVLVCDTDADRAGAFAQGAADAHGLDADVLSIADAVPRADVVVTVTPVHEPLIMREMVRAGTHINAIGADAAGKRELDPAILLDAKVVVDNWEQASHGGEINLAVTEGLIGRDDLHADIGQVVTGKRPGRESDDEITVFDSTGLAIQDVACAAHVYRRLTSDPEAARKLQSVDFLA